MKNKAEERIQQEIVQWFRNHCCLKHHVPRCKIFSIPNVGVAGVRHQMTLVATGLTAGASDLVVLLPGRHALFVEVKTAEGRHDPKQKEFQQEVEALGFKYHLVRSLEDFRMIPHIVDIYNRQRTIINLKDTGAFYEKQD